MAKKQLSIIWSHRPYSPYVMGMAVEATVCGFKKVFPRSSINYGINYYKNGQNTYLYPTKQYINTANALVRQVTSKPELLLNILKSAFRKSLLLNKYSRSFTSSKIESASTAKLISWVEHFSKLFIEMYAYGTAAILVGYSQDNILYKTAEKILKDKTKGETGAFADFYVILTNQPRLNRNVNFELEIIKLAKRASATNRKKITLIKKYYGREVKRIINKYGWLSYDLCDEMSWDASHIVSLIKERVDQDFNNQYRDLMAYQRITRANFQTTVRKLNLTKKEINVFEAIRNLGYYKWAREYEFTEALYRLKVVQDELARRLNISSLAIKYLLAPEYSSLLEDVDRYRVELSKRIKESLITHDYQKGYSLFLGTQAAKEWNKIKPLDKNNNPEVAVVKGSPAYGGIVRGTVRIVNSVRHISKISDGDILVAVTTSPALLPAMKKAAAIVTNEGGITSHAAIVSRELQIPCIVGAKNATRIFKGGQTVEVDAKHGIIRLVKDLS